MAWGEEQEMEAEDNWNRFVRRQQAIWTPKDIFQKCCVKWLVNGPEDRPNWYTVVDPFEDQWNDGNLPHLGCDYCQKNHPVIDLSFDEEKGCVIALLRYPLDPFVIVMDVLVNQGVAQKIEDDPIRYKLEGSIHDIVKRIRKMNTVVKKHLLRYTKKCVAQSKAAKKAKKTSPKHKQQSAAKVQKEVESEEDSKPPASGDTKKKHPADTVSETKPAKRAKVDPSTGEAKETK